MFGNRRMGLALPGMLVTQTLITLFVTGALAKLANTLLSAQGIAFTVIRSLTIKFLEGPMRS